MDAISTEAVQSALKSQYHSALAMLKAAIRYCPDKMWLSSGGHANPFWRIAYHALYYTHLYLQPNYGTFVPWARHQEGIHRFEKPLKTMRPYGRAEVLAYWSACDSMVDDAVDALDLNESDSGFWWYKGVPKLEHQILNIRHIQYHQSQLADRLRLRTGKSVNWASTRRRQTRPASGKAGRRTAKHAATRG